LAPEQLSVKYLLKSIT